MTSLLPTIEAKSDQLNADDLIGGPRTVKVTGVKVNTSEDQPVWIHFEGDNNKPFKPCKTVRRLLIQVWGDNADEYAGRSMTLYLDENVKYGGMAVGGIRVSHVSHIDGPRRFFLAETRGKKKQHTVQPLKVEKAQQMPAEPDQTDLNAALSALDAAESIDALISVWGANKDLHKFAEFVRRKDARKEALSQPADNF